MDKWMQALEALLWSIAAVLAAELARIWDFWRLA